MKGKKQEPNYDILLSSNISFTRWQLEEWKKLYRKLINSIHITDDGEIILPNNFKELCIEVERAQNRFIEEMNYLIHFKEFVKERKKENE